jgi:hypothetical protein
MAARSKTLTGSPPADQTITTSDGRLMGWSLRESAGTPAVAACNIREGSASGDIIAVLELAADSSSNVWFGPGGVNAVGGIYFDVVAGEITGAVYFA